MTTKGIAMHRNIGRHRTGSRTMRIPGTDVLLTRVDANTDGSAWQVTIGETTWIIAQAGFSHGRWQGYTPDRSAETPRCKRLAQVVRYLLAHPSGGLAMPPGMS